MNNHFTRRIVTGCGTITRRGVSLLNTVPMTSAPKKQSILLQMVTLQHAQTIEKAGCAVPARKAIVSCLVLVHARSAIIWT